MKLYYIVTHISVFIWVLVWWSRFWFRKEKDRPKGKWWWNIQVREYQTPNKPIEANANFLRLIFIILLAIIPNFLFPNPSFIQASILILSHTLIALFFGPFIYWRITFIRLIPLGCLLLIYLTADIGTFLISWIEILKNVMDNQHAIKTFRDFLGPFSLLLIGTVGGILIVFWNIYNRYVKLMGIDENPAPILFLFLLSGLGSIFVTGLWVAELFQVF